MTTVTIHQAKTHLSRLLARVEQGETIVVARGPRLIARLSPMKQGARVFGKYKGKIRIARDFDTPLPDEILRPFRGERD